jgi:hypothetical protein
MVGNKIIRIALGLSILVSPGAHADGVWTHIKNMGATLTNYIEYTRKLLPNHKGAWGLGTIALTMVAIVIFSKKHSDAGDNNADYKEEFVKDVQRNYEFDVFLENAKDLLEEPGNNAEQLIEGKILVIEDKLKNGISLDIYSKAVNVRNQLQKKLRELKKQEEPDNIEILTKDIWSYVNAKVSDSKKARGSFEKIVKKAHELFKTALPCLKEGELIKKDITFMVEEFCNLIKQGFNTNNIKLATVSFQAYFTNNPEERATKETISAFLAVLNKAVLYYK